MQPTQTLTPDQQFFFDHAGYSHDPRTQTEAEGRTECAIALAAAEQRYLKAHQVDGVRIEWLDDHQSAWDLKHEKVKFQTCEGAKLVTADGEHITSLWAITDASDEYRRVIRAELALEAFPVQS